MYQQGPGQPLPPDRDTVRALAGRTWKWWRSLGRGSQALLIGIVLLVFLVRGCNADDRAGTSAEPAASLPTATATSSSSPTASAVRLGGVPEDPDRSTKKVDAEEYAAWLNRLGDLEVSRDSLQAAVADMERLADTYGSTDGDTRLVGSVPNKGSRVRSTLRSAAKQLEFGHKALRKGQYDKAEDAFTSATRKLKGLRDSVQSDLEAIERANALRLTRDGAVSDDSSTDNATVISWIDGDTVDTDKGRVGA